MDIVHTKPLDRMTLSELLDLYGATVWAIAYGSKSDEIVIPNRSQLFSDKAAIEGEARRRDQMTWMPVTKTVNRTEEGDILFA